MDKSFNAAKFVSVPEMVAIEKEADSRGLTYQLMMENAGSGLADTITSAYSHLRDKSILALVGSGNNGGDALVALSHMVKTGWKASAYLVRPRSTDDPLITRFLENGGSLYSIEDDSDYQTLNLLISGHKILLDGILGTGVRLPLKGELVVVLKKVQAALADYPNKDVVAVDCPSGADCDTGDVPPECIPADLTVTMAAYKQGLLKFPAYEYVGKLTVVGIGLEELSPLPSSLTQINRFVPDSAWINRQLPLRQLNTHKGSFGTAMIVAGSVHFTGAALLAGLAAYRIGVGLVMMAVPKSIHLALAGHFPDAIWLPLFEHEGAISSESASIIFDNIERITALLLGPGFGLNDATNSFVKNFFQEKNSRNIKLPPMVIDADGLKLLVKQENWMQELPEKSILTPHPGEMSILTGLSTREIQADRIRIAEAYARKWGHIVVLKGAFTVIASPDGICAVIPVASPALAKAGTGDVLAGLITGLRAQGVEAFQAAVTGSYLHAMSGLAAADSFQNTASVMASDLPRFIAKVIGEL